jgi:hypothetical protein
MQDSLHVFARANSQVTLDADATAYSYSMFLSAASNQEEYLSVNNALNKGKLYFDPRFLECREQGAGSVHHP